MFVFSTHKILDQQLTTMESNAALITSFYESFQRRDGAAMGQCYAPNATFRDEAFDLKGEECGAMWEMLTSRAKPDEFKIEFRNVTATEQGGFAHWTATYAFGPKQRRVVNEIDSVFTIEQGLIVKQVDTFPFHTWASQALGTVGWLFGWFPPFHWMIRSTAMKGLKGYMAKKSKAVKG